MLLRFPKDLVAEMKLHGNAACAGTDVPFVSSNDMVTAMGWVMMGKLSQNNDWGMNVCMPSLMHMTILEDECMHAASFTW